MQRQREKRFESARLGPPLGAVIILSLAIHAVGAWFIPTFEAPPAPRSEKIRVRIVSTPPSRARVMVQKVDPARMRKPSGAPRRAGQAVNDLQPKSPTRYRDWLPSLGELPVEGVGGDTPSGRMSPAERSAASEWQDRVDIPFFLRKHLGPGKARVRMRLVDDHTLKIVSLTGDADLRAVLYEALSSPGNHRSLRRLFSETGYQAISVTLKFSLGKDWSSYGGSYRWVEKAEDLITVHQKRVIGRMGPPEAFGTGGVALSDKHAQLAKKRDRVHLRKLRSGIAYQAPLRNRTIRLQ